MTTILLFITTILLPFLHLLYVMSRHVMYSTSNVLYLYYFSTCYVNTLRTTFQLFSSYFVQIWQAVM